MKINEIKFRLQNEGDNDCNLWVAIDTKERAIASGRDKSQVAKNAQEFLERENAMIEFLATPSLGEVFHA